MAAGFADVGRLVATLGLNTTPFMASMGQAQNRMAAFSNAAMMLGRTMTRFVTIPMALAGGAAVNTQKNFEASMTKIIGLVGVSREQVEKWNKEVLAMARATGRGPEELADALYFVTSAGIRGAEAMQVLEMSAKASASGLGDTKVIADLVTSAINAYGKENLSAAEATDILVASVREGKAEADELAGAMGMVLPIASEFGVTFDQVGAAFAGMTRTGTNARVAATQLKAILSGMASPSEQTKKALAEVNMSAEGFRKTIKERGLINALLDLRHATMGNEEALANIFPNIRGLMGVLDLLGANVEYNVQIFDALTNASGSLKRAFAEVGGTTQQQLNVALATFKSTLVAVGEALKPFVTKVLANMNDMLVRLTTKWDSFTESQKKVRKVMLAVLAVAGPLGVVMSRLIMILTGSLGPWVAAAAAIAVLTVGIIKLVQNMQQWERVTKQSNKRLEELNENIIKEEKNISLLYAQLNSVTKGTEAWHRAKEKINSTYGKYMDNLVSEKMTEEELEKSIQAVTKARLADMKVKGYTQELETIETEYGAQIQKEMKRWTKAISKGRSELLDETGKTAIDFELGLQKLFKKAEEVYEASGREGFWKKQDMLEGMEPVLAEFEQEFFGKLSTAPNRRSFAKDFWDAYATNLEKGMQTSKIEEILAKAQAEMPEQGGVDLGLENLDKNIKILEDMKGETEEIYRLDSLIILHKKKLPLLTEAQQQVENEIINQLKEQLALEVKKRQGMGIETKLEGEISRLEKERTKLGKEGLQANAEKIRAAKLELREIQNQTSGLGEIEQFREAINIKMERAKELSGDARKNALEEIRTDQQLLALMEAEEASLGKLARKELEILQLKDDKRRASDQEAAEIQKLIDKAEEEKAIQKDLEAGLNYMAKEQNRINREKTKLLTLDGDALKLAEEKIFQDQLKLNAYKREHGALTEIGKLESALLDLELERLRVVDPGRAAQLDAEITAKKRELAQVSGEDTFGESRLDDFVKGSKKWFETMNDIIAKKKAYRDVLDEESSEYAAADKNYKSSLQDRLGAYLDYVDAVLGAASTMANAMGTLIENQKQRELSAAGDNAKKREAIEKKYYEKQKKWAVAQAAINMAVGATAALRGIDPITKWIEFAAVLTAGAVQIAAIKAASFAQGGIVSGPTLGLMGEYPGVKSNPEVIAPLDKLQAMLQPRLPAGMPKVIELKLKGRDAYAMINMEQLMRNAY